MIPLSLDLESFFENIVKPCRKGDFIYIISNSKNNSKKIKKLLTDFKIPNKRGVWCWKGIIIVSEKFNAEFKKYFDKIYEVI